MSNPMPCTRTLSFGVDGALRPFTSTRALRARPDAPGRTRPVTSSILQQVAAGDEQAMQSCIDRYGGLVWSIARRLTPSDAEAEDAVQEIFIELWENAFRYEPAFGSEVTFIATIARRRLIDRLRSDGRRRERLAEKRRRLEMAGHPCASATTDAESRFEDIARIRRAIERLHPQQQRVLQMAIHHGCTHDQIAQQTGLPLGTVKTHARRGLQRLRELLGVSTSPAPEAGSLRGGA